MFNEWTQTLDLETICRKCLNTPNVGKKPFKKATPWVRVNDTQPKLYSEEYLGHVYFCAETLMPLAHTSIDGVYYAILIDRRWDGLYCSVIESDDEFGWISNMLFYILVCCLVCASKSQRPVVLMGFNRDLHLQKGDLPMWGAKKKRGIGWGPKAPTGRTISTNDKMYDRWYMVLPSGDRIWVDNCILAVHKFIHDEHRTTYWSLIDMLMNALTSIGRQHGIIGREEAIKKLFCITGLNSSSPDFLVVRVTDDDGSEIRDLSRPQQLHWLFGFRMGNIGLNIDNQPTITKAYKKLLELID